MSSKPPPPPPKEPKVKIRKENYDNFTPDERLSIKKKTGKEIWELDISRILVLRRKYGLPGTSGTFFSNYFVWMKQEHPLISMWFSHKKHPFTGRERMCVMWCSFAFAFLFTAVFNSMENQDGHFCKVSERASERDPTPPPPPTCTKRCAWPNPPPCPILSV